jgi:hypothetical protein
MTDENYVKIEIGKLTTIRFDAAVKQKKPVLDPALGFSKDITTLDLHITELNGSAVSTLLSISSSTLQKSLEPYLIDEKFRNYRFTLTKDPGAYAPPRIVSATPVV